MIIWLLWLLQSIELITLINDCFLSPGFFFFFLVYKIFPFALFSQILSTHIAFYYGVDTIAISFFCAYVIRFSVILFAFFFTFGLHSVCVCVNNIYWIYRCLINIDYENMMNVICGWQDFVHGAMNHGYFNEFGCNV